jgi:hypothetical protein
MKRYYFIPTEFEGLISQMITAWEAQSPTAYVVCTGVYRYDQVNELGENEDSLVYDMRKRIIPKVFYSQMGENLWNKFTLRGFTLEGEFPQQYHELAMSLKGAFSTQSNIEYIEFINSTWNGSQL